MINTKTAQKVKKRTFGDQTESTLPLLNLLDALTVNNVHRLQAMKFTHSWHKADYQACFMISFNMAVKYTYYTR